MKSSIDRRRFLEIVAAGAAGLAAESILAACGAKPNPVRKQETTLPPQPGVNVSQTGKYSSTQSDTSGSTSGISEFPQMVVARGGSPEALVERSLAALGGMERFVNPGNDVIIKPNICVAYHSYEYAATTNPWVVGALVKLCLAAGAGRVRVMDYPFGGEADQAYAISGIAEQVAANGGSMVTMSRFKYVTTPLPDAAALKEADFYEDILKADVLINVPIAKHHSLAGLTLGMKNLMGTVLHRETLHRQIGQNLADLAGFLKPDLTILDAVRILTANGPSGGNLNDVRQLDTLIASPDILAADTYAASLFNIDPFSLDYIKAGSAAGLGQSDLSQIKIEEIAVGG